jgi:hypothetical protein
LQTALLLFYVCIMIEREEQIFQLWRKHLFAERALQTADGKELRILFPGILNRDSGADFFGARIELDGQEWSGNIEIHVRASDWLRHGHTTDKAFSNVILHVVHVHDCKIFDDHGNVIPVLVLTDDLLRDVLLHDVKEMTKVGLKKVKEPKSLKTLKTIGTPQSLETLGVQRLYRRSIGFQVELAHLKGDMEALFQRHLFRRFGMRTNSEPFQQLAHRVPGTIIRRQRNNLTDLESILFGQAGLLPEIPVDGYSADLLYRYTNFRYKYSLEPMYVQAWKFMRMRPSNFPTVRISQLATLLHQEEHIYTRCMNRDVSIEDLRKMLDVKASEYWDEHFRFEVHSGKNIKQLGEEAVDSILINAVGTIRYFLGIQRDDENLKDSAVELLREIAPENNAAIRQSGRKPVNALQSQGLLELLTHNGGSNDENNVVCENDFAYFSVAQSDRAENKRRQAGNHEGNQSNRQNRNVVREPRVRSVRLVG